MTHSGVLHLIAGLVFVALAIVAMALEPGERRATFVKGVLYVLSLGVQAIAWALGWYGFPTTSGMVQGLGVLGEGLCLISMAGTAVFRVALPRLGVLQPRIVQDVSVAGACILWAFIRLRIHNVDLTSLIATSAVVTAVLGLSLQDTLGNILGGMVIQFDQSIGVGDWIMVDDQKGQVVEIRWRYTAIETRNWETVVIPNSMLLKNKVIVLGRRRGQPVQWRRWVWFNVDYRFQPSRVIETANRAIRLSAIPNMARRPEPSCVLMDFADSVGRYAVRYWLTDLGAGSPTDSEVRKHLFFALKRAGIPLSIPAQAIFLTKESRKRKALKADEAITHRVEALGRVDLFHSLQAEELHHLAERLVPAPFARDDVILRQGDEAHGLYLLVEGTADVIVDDGHGRSRKVASLGPGSFFGEMGLITGEPRTATVVARSEVECYRLEKAAFQEVISARPVVAEDISHILARRRTELEAALENLDAESRGDRLSIAHHDFLGKIRHFFGLDGSV
jgi:CRP-like cAMP-binding protein